MDPVSNVDRLVLLLRQRLQQRDRMRSAGTSRSKAGEPSGGLAAAQSLAAIEDIDDRQLRRTLVQGLLSEQFGQAALNEARFQQIVDRVVAAIEGDEAGRQILDRLSKDLRVAARR